MKGLQTGTYRLSQTFNAPKEFVFDWCTDFREDDYKMTGSTARRRFLERTKDRIIWVVNYRQGKRSMEGVRAVWLKPKDSWHFDTCGDGREIGDYQLKELKGGKTRLDMVFTVTYEDPSEVESSTDWVRGAKNEWSIFRKFLEKDFKTSAKAKIGV